MEATEQEESEAALLFGHNFLDSEGNPREMDPEEKPELIVVFFSASWFRPSNELGEKLLEFYNHINERGQVMEVLEVSNERYEHDYNKNKTDKPWLFVPYRECVHVFNNYNVTDVPQLYIVSKRKSNVLNYKCKKELLEQGFEVGDPWKKLVNENVEAERQEEQTPYDY